MAVDVTQQAESGKKMDESEQHYRQLADALPALVWEADQEGNQVYASRRWKEFTGLDPENSTTFEKMVHPEDKEGILRAWAGSLATGQTYRHEVRLKSKEGKYHWFQVHGEPVYNDKKEIEKWVGTFTDVNDSKEAEQAIKTELRTIAEDLKKAKEQLELTFRNVPAAIYHFDKNGKILYLNEKGATLMGYSSTQEVPLEKDIFQFRKRVEETYLLLDQTGNPLSVGQSSTAITFKTLVPSEVVTEMVNKETGESIWLLSHSAPLFDEGGELSMVLTTSTDISFQKTTEKILRYRKALLEAHNEADIDGVLLVDARGKILSNNKRFMEIWNIPQHIVDARDDEAALSFAMSQLKHPEQFIEKVKYLYLHPTETSRDILEFKDGKIIERYGYPVVGEDGTYYAWSWTFKDVTEQNQAEKKLKDREKQLQKTKEHFEIATTAAEVGTWSLDLSSNTLIWSNLHKKMWGYDENSQDLVYEDWYKLILEVDKEMAFGEVKKALETKTLYEAYYRIRRADNGKIRWIRSVGQYFYNELNEPITLTGVSIDVTDQQKAEIALKESENLYHNLIYSSPSAIGILKGPDLVITRANDAIIKIWGKGKDVFGKSYFEMLPELAEQGYREVFNKVYTTGEASNFVETPVYIQQEGVVTLKYYNFILYPQRNTKNEVEGIGIIATEVTPQAELNKKIRESEKNFRQLSELMPDLVSTADPDGNITYYSANWEEYTGIEREKLYQEGWAMVVHSEDVARVAKNWRNCVATGTDFETELRLKNKNGVYKWHLSRAVPVRNENEVITKWIGSMTEIQQQKEQTEELEKSVAERTNELKVINEQLIQSNEDLQQFAHVASHDLREPLRKITTFANRLLDDEETVLSERGHYYLSKMQSASDRMNAMIEGVLAYSMIDASVNIVETINLDDTIKNVETDLEIMIQQKEATIVYSNLPKIEGSTLLIYQLFYNLVYNALKFSSANETQHISINSKIITNGHVDFAQISVQDRGIGFEPQDAEKIFVAFGRLNSKDKYEGTGLGLTLCRKIAERHGGSITASGGKNMGATFIVTLPLKQNS